MEPVTTDALVAEMRRVLGPKRAATAIGSALAQKLVGLAFAWANASPERRLSVLAHGKRDILEWHRRAASAQRKTLSAKTHIPGKYVRVGEMVHTYSADIERGYVGDPLPAMTVRKAGVAKKLKGTSAKKVKAVAKRRKATAKKFKTLAKTRRKAAKKAVRKRAVAKATRKRAAPKVARKANMLKSKTRRGFVGKGLLGTFGRMPGRM